MVFCEKDDGSLRVTVDAKNVNKAIQSSNLPIPRQEDIKAKLAHKKFYSKLDFKSAFWQLELDEESRDLTVFQMLGKLYRHTVLTMGFKPSQGELNAALVPLFAHISDVHVIHDDVVVATTTEEEHVLALQAVLETIANAGLTLNPAKCVFLQKEIKFWGMIIGESGVRPDPEKVDDLQYVTRPQDKPELISFLCMMQSNSEFIPQFAKKSAVLRDLTKGSARFKWEEKHQACFEDLIAQFRKDVTLRYFDMQKKTFVFTDGHKSGLGAILAQGDDIHSAKAVAVASRRTSVSEQHYPQIDREAAAVDYGLVRFRNYVVGAPDTTVVVTDHKPLVPIFNGKRPGSFRTEKIKLRHQNINFKVLYQKGSTNRADYLSRHSKPLEKASEEEKSQSNELNNFLYMLHSTPVIDHITLAAIARETAADPTLKELSKIIKQSKTWIPKAASEEIRRFSKILPELTITGNGIILKAHRIVLPESLQQLAIELAHRGSHPAQSSMERRLRAHFYFHDMSSKIDKLLSSCLHCASFNNKKSSEPLSHHQVPENIWDTVAVDLYGPMPSRNHVVVVQDLSSKYPAAKLVSNTSAEKVIPALADIYDMLGNPSKQISDNGPPFNSKHMSTFADRRNIQLQKIPPRHPASNPAETFMRPLGKTMKIAHASHSSEKAALQTLLQNYRNTPHSTTGISPATMMFRDGEQTVFPRVKVTDEQVAAAQAQELIQKQCNQEKINSGKFRVSSCFAVGDRVLMRNYNKTRKFDPIFSPDPCVVVDVADNGRLLTIERLRDGAEFRRHPDDVRLFHGDTDNLQRIPTEQEIFKEYLSQFPHYAEDEDADGDSWEPLQEQQVQAPGGRPQRVRQPNRRYYNENFVNN